MLSVTIGLGVWQVQRLHWKQGLLAQIDAAEAEPPRPLDSDPRPFERVSVTGTFLPVFARYGSDVRPVPGRGSVLGSSLVSPLVRPGQPVIVVNRGWAPETFDGLPPTGPVTVVGYIRPAEYPIRFGAADNPAARRFYALDPAAIGAALGVAQAAPYTLVQLGPPGSLPEPADALPRPSNDHLSYAMTWFGLSAALLVILVIYLRQKPAR